MRTFSFKARNVGDEKYLTYTMGEECELDEDVFDYCEEHALDELISVIYEEDDDYDYLTYDITGKTSLGELISGEMKTGQVLPILKNIAGGLISVKEQAIPLAYILLNRNFVYVDEADYKVKFICLPVESDAAIAAEFKGFIRQLLANMKYDVEEDLSYVGQLLTYINGDTFNLRGLVGLAEALMDEAGISYEAEAPIDADGVEVVDTSEAADAVEVEEEKNENRTENKVSDFMKEADSEALPEIGDDEEDGEAEEEIDDDSELESILPAGMQAKKEENGESVAAPAENKQAEAPKEPAKDPKAETAEEAPKEAAAEPTQESVPEKAEEEETPKEPETPKADTAEKQPKQVKTPVPKSTDVDVVAQRVRKIMGNSSETPASLDDAMPTVPMTGVKKKNVIKVNRAAIVQNVAAEQEGQATVEEEAAPAAVAEQGAPAAPAAETPAEDAAAQSKSILTKTIAEPPKPSVLNAPKAVPYLIRVNTNERIMLNKPIFKIGKASRGVDYTVDGNGAISRVHAIISQRDDVCYIKDNKSTNHTYVNNVVIEDGAEEILTHDSTVRLGDEEFKFKIR